MRCNCSISRARQFNIGTTVGIISILIIACNVLAVDVWREDTYSEFMNGTTFTNIEVKQVGLLGWIHMTDESSESHTNIYNPQTATPLFDVTPGNPPTAGLFVESFIPTFEGIVDKVEVKIYYSGSPEHTEGGESEAAHVTISIIGSIPNQNPALPNTANVRSTITKHYNDFPSSAGTWTTVWFSGTDSVGIDANILPLDEDSTYWLLVTSDADFDPGQTDEVLLEYTGNTDNANYTSYHRTWVWNQTTQIYDPAWGSNLPGTWDYPFKVYLHDFHTSGTYISSIHNTGAPSSLSDTDMESAMPTGLPYPYDGVEVTIALFIRGGDTQTPDETWCEWGENPSPLGQYIQYKLEFSSNDHCYNGGVTMVEITTI